MRRLWSPWFPFLKLEGSAGGAGDESSLVGEADYDGSLLVLGQNRRGVG
jgi:hypothetical protein